MNKDDYTLDEKMVDVGDKHKVYAQLWGNKDAQSPLIFLHGGPGSSTSDKHKGFFDPDKHLVLFFDQRGAGKSTPAGSVEHNTIDDLVGDITKLADSFGLETFSLVGGSWGSTLALVYAIREPVRVERLYLRGIFTARKPETDFVDRGGFRWFYPEVWEEFIERTPEAERKNAAHYHDQQVLSADKKAAKQSAYALSEMEGSILRLSDLHTAEDFEKFDMNGTRVMRHYISQGCFLPDNYIFDNAEKIKIPVKIVQGRYDMVCPPVTAYELSKRLPDATLIWTIAGHSGDDRESLTAMRTFLLAHPD